MASPLRETNGHKPPVLALRGVGKSYGSGERRTEVLANVDFELADGELAAIVGFSGTGKTTLLSILAGLLEPDAGSVEMGGEPAPGPGPARGVVFQSYALLPWLTVLENVQLAVDAVETGPAAERRERARHWVKLVGLGHAEALRPKQLSGGMRQRVAVARALAMSPRILLLDEPLGALDALTRASLQGEIAQILSRERTRSAVLVTNDVDEAILLADRIIPLVPGPPASLGFSFQVPFFRPRDRTLLNRDPSFKKLRNEIVAYLLELAGRRAGRRSSEPQTPLPDLRPVAGGRGWGRGRP